MTVKYEFTLSQWNPNIDLETVVSFYNGTMEKPMVVLIPYSEGYNFEEHLKKFADVRYQITAVKDVLVTADGTVVDGTHDDYEKEEWT